MVDIHPAVHVGSVVVAILNRAIHAIQRCARDAIIDDVDHAANGTAAYAEITDSDDNIVVSIPAVEGTTAVPGYVVLPALAIITTGEVEILSAVIG